MSVKGKTIATSKPRLLLGGMTENQGGKEAFIMNAFHRLKDRYDCWFIADRSIAYADEITEAGGTIVRVAPRGSAPLRYLRDLDRLIRDNHFTAVWLNQTVVNSIEPLVIARRHGVPYRILHSHSSRNMGSRLTGALHTLQRPLVPLVANRRFACSQPAAEWFFGKRSYTFIPNLFGAASFTFDATRRAEMRAELGFADETLVVAHVARLGPEKNHAFSLEILTALLARDAEAVLVLVGDGPLRDDIRHRVEEAGLSSRVQFLGMRDDVDGILQASDALILPSHFEGLPFTALEGQAAGLPVILSSAVTREADASPLATFLSLEAGPQAWADGILRAVEANDRSAGGNPLVGTPFDSARGQETLLAALAFEREGAAT